MRSLFIFALLLLLPGESFSQETGTAVSSAPAADVSSSTAPAETMTPAVPDEASVLLDSIKKTLAENSASLDERKKWLVIYELSSAGGKINEILSGSYSVECSTSDFRQALHLVRKSLTGYYIKNGRRLRNLDELVPYHLPCLPLITLKGGPGNAVKYVRDSSFDRDFRKAVDGSTEYLYFSDPQSVHYGLFIINSGEESDEKTAYCLY